MIHFIGVCSIRIPSLIWKRRTSIFPASRIIPAGKDMEKHLHPEPVGLVEPHQDSNYPIYDPMYKLAENSLSFELKIKAPSVYGLHGRLVSCHVHVIFSTWSLTSNRSIFPGSEFALIFHSKPKSLGRSLNRTSRVVIRLITTVVVIFARLTFIYVRSHNSHTNVGSIFFQSLSEFSK